MIQKVIHYCWFGGAKKTKLVKKCIKSWTKFCPDYCIIEWNESNYDLRTAPLFVQQAAEAKKWAFVSDYVRLKVVYEHGGIYLDTDVEIVRNMDFLLNQPAYFGFEFTNLINTGLGFGAIKGFEFLRELMRVYEDIPLLSDGEDDYTACPERDTDIFVLHGLKKNGEEQFLDKTIHIYPSEYFCPGRWRGMMKITPNTVSVHWYASSWHTKQMLMESRKKQQKIIISHYLKYANHLGFTLLGKEKCEQIKVLVKKIKRR